MATNETIKLKVSSNQESTPLNVDSGSPYYVGARAYVTQLEDGAEITVTDKEGTTTATVHDGDAGADGYSPTATVAKSSGTTTITITDKNGTTTAEVHDGVDSVTDVQVDGSSVVSSGVATIPKASESQFGVVRIVPPTDTGDALPTEDDNVYALIYSDSKLVRVPTLGATTGLVEPKYLPKATLNKYGIIKAGYYNNPPAGHLRVVTGEGYNSEVCVPALQTNNNLDPRGTISPRHLPKATATEFGAVKIGTAGVFVEHNQTGITTDDGSVTIPVLDDSTHTIHPTKLPDATTTAKGAMSASDKAKLDSIGSGVPDGGTTGQVLSKASGTDYDLEWVTPSGGGTITDVEVDGTSVVTGGVAEIDLTGKSDVGHTHTKSAITDFPTTVSSFTNDAGYITGYTETDPVFTASAASGITSSDISTWNGKYAKPSTGIPKTDLASAVQTSLGKADTALQSFTETDPVFSASAASGISSSDISNWNGKSDFSGSYNDLSDKPTIPTVNDATLTIQKNGTTVNTFTANASSNVTANISVPTVTSDLFNDSGFITSADLPKEYDFTTSLAPAIDARGVTAKAYTVTPADASQLTVENCRKVSAYLISSGGGGTEVKPLIVTDFTVSSSILRIYVKSIYGSTQSTTSISVSGTLHVVAPFEISNVTAYTPM